MYGLFSIQKSDFFSLHILSKTYGLSKGTKPCNMFKYKEKLVILLDDKRHQL